MNEIQRKNMVWMLNKTIKKQYEWLHKEEITSALLAHNTIADICKLLNGEITVDAFMLLPKAIPEENELYGILLFSNKEIS
jgi:hypothetical protein